ncbi:MAG: C4-type zinc ribbon domain-containing protein [Elusimicrobia bacterium]|nr:C4-type zinc ribbon domain-containing protein [Candidatus Obscuribacterium magneticum]
MQNDLQLLLQLQTHDSALDELTEKADALSAAIQALNQSLESMKSALKSAKEALSSHQVKKKQLEMDADAKDQLVKKHHAELNALKSNEAYRAMLGEINTAKEALRKIEDELLSVMEQIENEEKEFKAKEQLAKSEDGKGKAEIQTLESEKAALLAEIKTKQEARDQFAATISDALKAPYENVRKKRGGLAVVPMVNSSCGGCQMNLTPNKMNEVKKGRLLILCDVCSRFVYLPSAMASAASEKPAPVTPTETPPLPTP